MSDSMTWRLAEAQRIVSPDEWTARVGQAKLRLCSGELRSMSVDYGHIPGVWELVENGVVTAWFSK